MRSWMWIANYSLCWRAWKTTESSAVLTLWSFPITEWLRRRKESILCSSRISFPMWPLLPAPMTESFPTFDPILTLKVRQSSSCFYLLVIQLYLLTFDTNRIINWLLSIIWHAVIRGAGSNRPIAAVSEPTSACLQQVGPSTPPSLFPIKSHSVHHFGHDRQMACVY